MVATFEVNLGKDGGSCEHIQHVIKSRNGKPVFNSDFVDGSAIQTHSPCAIFLGCEKDWDCTWTLADLNEALSHEFFYLPPELRMLDGVEAVMGKVGQGCPWDEVNGMLNITHRR